MKLLRYFFQKRMVLNLLLILTLINLLSNQYKHIGVSKTVGWAWSFSLLYSSPLIFLILFYIFLLGYGIIALSKRETNLKFSILHTAIILTSAILIEINEIEILMVCNVLSFIIFFANVFGSLSIYKHAVK